MFYTDPFFFLQNKDIAKFEYFNSTFYDIDYNTNVKIAVIACNKGYEFCSKSFSLSFTTPTLVF